MSEKKIPDLIVSSERNGDTVVVKICGEIDLHNSPELRKHMLQHLDGTIRSLILNLAQVPYMDSSAIAVFVEGLQKLRKTGGKIFLTNLQPRVKGLLEIARLDTIFVVCADEAAAVAAAAAK
jgi:anti-anti-sigma factor